MILCREELAKKIDKAIFPGIQGGPLLHIIAAKAVCFGEALKPEFRAYQEQIVKNAKILADTLVAEGFDLVSGGTDNHLMLVDLRRFGVTGKEMEHRLDEVHTPSTKEAHSERPAEPVHHERNPRRHPCGNHKRAEGGRHGHRRKADKARRRRL